MDPKLLTASDWQQVDAAVRYFWLFAGALVVTALSFGLAQAPIPSLIASRELPAGVSRIRPVLYGVAAVGLVFSALLLYLAISSAFAVARGIYPRIWI